VALRQPLPLAKKAIASTGTPLATGAGLQKSSLELEVAFVVAPGDALLAVVRSIPRQSSYASQKSVAESRSGHPGDGTLLGCEGYTVIPHPFARTERGLIRTP